MPRLALATILAALLVTAGFIVGSSGRPAATIPMDPALAAMGIAAVALSAVAVLIGLYATIRARRTQMDVDRLARSMDAALRRMEAGTDYGTTSVAALTEALNRDIGGLLDRIARGDEAAATAGAGAPSGDNILPLQAPGRRATQGGAAPGQLGIEFNLDRPLEISLQPIVAVAESAAAGFEVHARIALADGSEKDVRRIAGNASAAELARFECALVRAAVETSRRQLGAQGDGLPLHVPVSAALLVDADAVRDLEDLFRLHPAAAMSLVFSLPGELFTNAPLQQRKSIAALAAAGIRFAAEGWDAGRDEIAALPGKGVAFLRLGANRLLDREKSRRRSAAASDIIEAANAAGLTILASDVSTDEDAVSLIDLGVDLMVGERFSAPRRLKSPGAVADARAVGA
ncbi:MAG: EAL domain-containing protein, partial [Mesorhizobium sp.]|nr:EAL domain-containing protein [Mesorhizobium sp.]